jgi:hypothetical protein
MSKSKLNNLFYKTLWMILPVVIFMSFSQDDRAEKMKTLYTTLNTHKQLELKLELQYFEDFNNKTVPDIKGDLHYISSGDYLYIKRQESLYVHNHEHYLFVDHKRKRIIVSRIEKKNPLEKAGKEMMKNLNMGDLMNQSVTEHKITQENDSIKLHQIKYNNITLPESKIWLNENQSFFSRVEYKIYDNTIGHSGQYGKIVMITKSFKPNPEIQKEMFQNSTYFIKDEKGNDIPTKKYSGYKIIKQ